MPGPLLGDTTAAAAHVARLRELDLTELLAAMHHAREQALLHLKEGLRKAGF